MTTYKKLNIQEICDILTKPKDTLIIMHARPDGDAVGSAFALAELLGGAGSRCYCVCPDELPARLRFVSSQESCLYESIPAGFVPARVVTVDVASPSQLGGLEEVFRGRVDVMIDHHSHGIVFADNCLRPDMAATGEIIYELACEMVRRGVIGAISKTAQTCLYTAISADTGCFKYSSVTPCTMRRAAALLESGIDAAEINRLLFDSKSKELLEAERLALENMRYYSGGRIAVVTLGADEMRANGILYEDAETVIDVARSVAGVLVGAAVKQTEEDEREGNGRYRVSLRSNSYINVAEIACEFGGGGHAKAAGCTVVADSIAAAAAVVVRAVETRI